MPWLKQCLVGVYRGILLPGFLSGGANWISQQPGATGAPWTLRSDGRRAAHALGAGGGQGGLEAVQRLLLAPKGRHSAFAASRSRLRLRRRGGGGALGVQALGKYWWDKSGSKFKSSGCAGFGLCFHSPRGHFGYIFLSHSHTVDGRNPAPPKKPWNHDSPVHTNKQWLPMFFRGCDFWIWSIHQQTVVSHRWCEMDFVHPPTISPPNWALAILLVGARNLGG